MNRHKLLKRIDHADMRVSILNPSYARLQLQSVLDGLNLESENRPHAFENTRWVWRQVDVTERQIELRRLVAMWEKANRNLEKLFKESPGLKLTCMSGTTMLIPSRDGAAQLAWSPDLRGWQSTAQKTEARKLFIGLLVNPLSLSLGGPCARCRQYFEKTNSRKTTYCGRECGKAMTAVARTKERQKQEYRDKLAPVNVAVREWEKSPKRGDWKRVVARETKVDLRFITQAVRRGKLIPPFGG